MKRFLFFISICIFACMLRGQETEYTFSLPKNPTKAALLSAFIPGAGQIYNERYLKASGVIATQGYLITQTINYNDNMKKYKNKRDNSTTPEERATNDFMFTDYHQKRQSFIFWIGFSVLMSAMDAYVDAHLINFKDKKKELDIMFTDDMIQLSIKF